MNKKTLIEETLIGLKVEITEARCRGYIGLKGRIVDETKNTFLLENDRIRRIPKKDVKFRFITSNGRDMELNGSMLIHRPEDRIKKIG
ncbi:MAG: ribonuclease P protein subunit [Candidatus Thermoplasmatota archaeon]|nr:ribonuclease P protein subunit [archaeon]MBU2565562.1 ribonuclease P protein subunit [Candidatus Thermoplasmatota archaeon]MBU3902265.1 ribonuclease P protein subunit [Candidatus Thermoplasmatota archaeon]MCG2827435.1 ribonuclease P protein subunit [Thermoplasmatales archaeon]